MYPIKEYFVEKRYCICLLHITLNVCIGIVTEPQVKTLLAVMFYLLLMSFSFSKI